MLDGITFFHGSPNEFSTFDPAKIGTTDSGWLGRGFYFYDNFIDAEQYGRVKSFNVLCEEPYFMSDDEYLNMADEDSLEKSISFTNKMIEEGYDCVVYGNGCRTEICVFDAKDILFLD